MTIATIRALAAHGRRELWREITVAALKSRRYQDRQLFTKLIRVMKEKGEC